MSFTIIYNAYSLRVIYSNSQLEKTKETIPSVVASSEA